MGSSEIGLAVLVTEVSNDLAKNPGRESESGLGLFSLSSAGSEYPHPVTQLPREFPHIRSLGPFQTYCQQIPELRVIEPLLMEDLGYGESSGHSNDDKALLLGPSKQRFDFDETRSGVTVLRPREVHFDLDPPEILWIPGLKKLNLRLSK